MNEYMKGLQQAVRCIEYVQQELERQQYILQHYKQEHPEGERVIASIEYRIEL